MTEAERHRAEVAAWRKTAPANDSDIFRYPRQSTPRHFELSTVLAALLKWRAISRPAPAALRTNWRIIPANDNRPEIDDDDRVEGEAPDPPIIECALKTRPTPEEMVRAIRKVKCRTVAGQIEAVDGDIEKRDGLVVRAGRLEFGTLQTEAEGGATVPGNNRQLIRWGGRRPVDNFGRARGPDIDEDEELAKRERLADWLGCDLWKASELTREEQRAAKRASRERAARCRGKPNPPLPPTTLDLNAARAFAGLPPVDVDRRTALPTATIDVGDIFQSWMSRPKNSNGGAVPEAEDHVDRDIIAAQLSPSDVTVLDAALAAKNFKDIGAHIGLAGKAAERGGKAVLVAATERLAMVLEKIAA